MPQLVEAALAWDPSRSKGPALRLTVGTVFQCHWNNRGCPWVPELYKNASPPTYVPFFYYFKLLTMNIYYVDAQEKCDVVKH